MKKVIFLAFIVTLFSFIVGCKSASKDDLYGWWRPEKETFFNNKCIYLSENIFKEGKEYNISSWKEKDGYFIMSFDSVNALLKINENGTLSFTPQTFGSGTYTFIRTTEDEVKKIKEEKDKKLKELTTSHSDPF